MKLALTFVLLCACGGKSSAPPATPSKPAPVAATKTTPLEPLPYMHECSDTGKQCALDECVAYKVAHHEKEDIAEQECMQDCNCGE
jgi:hypothetical protein